MIPHEITRLLETGVSVVVGTRDAALRPECTRAWGVRVHDDRTTVTIYLTESISAKTLENLRDNGRIAISCARPTDHVACQLKGRLRAVRAAEAWDESSAGRWKEDFRGELIAIGVPQTVVDALITSPIVCVDIEISDVFHQTPGPGAGEKLRP